MTLTFTDPPGNNDRSWNVILYGPPKTGKSTGAGSAPPKILWLNSESPSRLYLARQLYGDDNIKEVSFKKIQDSIDIIQYLKSPAADDIKTVIFDTVGQYYSLITQERMLASNRSMPSQPQYGECNIIIQRLCEQLAASRRNFIAIMHEKHLKDELSGKMLTVPMTGGQENPMKVSAMVDIIAYTGTKVNDDGTISYLSQLVPSESRYAGGMTEILGKVRPTNVGEWFEVLNEEIKEKK